MVVTLAGLGLLVIAVAGAHGPVRLVNSGRPPWPAPAAPGVAAGVRLAGLSLSAVPGVVTRYAVHLDIQSDGKRVPVPAGVGLDRQTHQIAPLYTSDGTGIVHVMSNETAARFTVGQFFDEWQVPLRDATAWLDGARWPGDPASLTLAPHQQILVSFGPIMGSVTGSVPARYLFPAGT